MLAFPAAIRIFVAVQPVDMRKSFNGLWSAVSEQLSEDPKSGAVFAFINRERTRLKLLYWDGYATRANMGRCDSRALCLPACKADETAVAVAY
jgi:transposase